MEYIVLKDSALFNQIYFASKSKKQSKYSMYVVVLEEPNQKTSSWKNPFVFLEEPSYFLGRTQLISWKNPVVGSNSGNTTKMSIRTQMVGTIRTK